MSGSVPADADQSLKSALEAAGHSVTILSASGADICDITPEAMKSESDMIIVWGGDGTTACVLNASGLDGPPVLALPGGSMNLVHQRMHYGQTDWENILSTVLKNPVPENFSAGLIGDARFYVAAMFGRLTRLTDAREAVRKGELLEAARTIVTSNAFDVNAHLTFRIAHAGESEVIEAAAGAIIVTGNRRPRLEVAAINPDSAFDLVSIGLQSWMKDWHEVEAVESDEGREVFVSELNGRSIPATLDGETCELSGAISARIVPQAARVFRARPSE